MTEKTKQATSPLPWRVIPGMETAQPPVWFIFDANNARVTGGFFSEADARFIVEAVNAHERLMEEVARLLDDNRWKSEVLGRVLQWLTNLVVTDSIEGMDELVDNVRNAIGEEAGNGE